MKLYINYPFNYYSFVGRIAAVLNDKQVEVIVASEELKASKEFKAKNLTGKYPFLETEEGNLSESIAIAKYIAHGHPTLNGTTNFEAAKVN